jgi:hypothetical protein
MNISELMGKQVAELQHTLNLTLLKSQMSTQTAAVTTMIEDMTSIQKATPAPHPNLGKTVDIKA